MKKRHITLLLAFVLCFSLFAVGVSAVSYNGSSTPLMETTTGEYGKLIWKQDFEDTSSVGNYSYDASYHSPYAADGATLSDTSLVWTGDGDGMQSLYESRDTRLSANTARGVISNTSSIGVPSF